MVVYKTRVSISRKYGSHLALHWASFGQLCSSKLCQECAHFAERGKSKTDTQSAFVNISHHSLARKTLDKQNTAAMQIDHMATRAYGHSPVQVCASAANHA